MKLIKRKDSPYWWYSFTIDGKRYRESTKRPFSDVTGANRVMTQEYQRVINITQFGEKSQIKPEEAFDTFLRPSSDRPTPTTLRQNASGWAWVVAKITGTWILSCICLSSVKLTSTIKKLKGKTWN